ncbi:Protein CBG10989 [Caenorhabditis briggsae]|nr:Protein CBG10989 [Caenorhabditis briggsae]CAP30239.1 Protein CBG10989 [Caenorhabditis briggsae]
MSSGDKDVPDVATDFPPAADTPDTKPATESQFHVDVFYELECLDGTRIRICRSGAKHSKTLDSLIEILGQSPENPIPIDNIDSATLKFIVHWCTVHCKDDLVEEEPHEVTIPDWDKTYLDQLNNKQLFKLIKAVCYLDIPVLLSYACKHVALQARGLNPEEMRKLFAIPTDEEDERAMKEKVVAAEKEKSDAAEKETLTSSADDKTSH